jgi:hypothetical protein
VAEGVYPNGLPHPPPALRLRMAIELVVILALTGIFLYFTTVMKMRSTPLYIGMALIGFALIGMNRQETLDKVWGPPDYPEFDRLRRAAVNVSLFTVPPIILFLILGMLGRYYQWNWFATATPMFSLHFFVAIVAYLPWAMLQQTLFQFYLLGRFRALMPFASPIFLSTLNGILYGLVHLGPSWEEVGVTGVTILGGIFWSYSYYRDRYVTPIAVSHALLGSTFYYWIYGRDLMQEMVHNFSK